MSRNSAEDLLPYLNPDYWGGHSIGYGEAIDAPLLQGVSIRTPKPIRGTFEERLAAMHRIIPIETFNSGETFEAGDYSPGTVVMFREERLSARVGQLSVDAETLKGQPIPDRPTDFNLATGISRASRLEFIKADGAMYVSRVNCGMVAETDQQSVVYATSAALIERVDTRVMATGAWLKYRMPTKIGETIHAKTKKHEQLHRINLLEVVAYGERERKKEKARGLTGKLAFRRSV